jgi:hypothetical protein
LREREELRATLQEVSAELEKEALEEGYSSRELEGPDSKKSNRQ